ncbi:uncharacterized protein LOC128736073 [Sabethes cyaneus]|uniref:uncharacterized protein LOC128736073 n=1 Tax=Sabethes cyaneus TaxID=53552 RepID=UPI00237EAD13|nr:uncharacterized protein LOC128736073 [Sabethes cyaneus]
MNGLLKTAIVLAVMASASFAYPQMDSGVIQRMSRNSPPRPEIPTPEMSDPEQPDASDPADSGLENMESEPSQPNSPKPEASREEPASSPTKIQMAAEPFEEPSAEPIKPEAEYSATVVETKNPEQQKSPAAESNEKAAEDAPIDPELPIEARQDSEDQRGEPISASRFAPIVASEPEQSPLASCSRAELKERVEAIIRQLGELKELCGM